MERRFDLEVHHGGCLQHSPHMSYIGGSVMLIPAVDPDCMSYIEIVCIVKELGYNENSEVYFRGPMQDANGGFKRILTDRDVLEMIKVNVNFDVIKLFVLAPIDILGDDFPMVVDNVITDEGRVFTVGNQFTSVLGDDFFVGGAINFSDVESIYAPSDELIRVYSSSDVEEEEEDSEFKEPRVLKRKTETAKKLLEEGMKFESAAKFREALREYAVNKKFELKFDKNEGNRVTATCSRNCGWRIHASTNTSDYSFEIRKFNDCHGCVGFAKTNSHATSTYLANMYLESLRDQSKWSSKSMIKEVKKDLDITVSKYKVRRARKKAMVMIEGDHGEQFTRVRDYCHLILTTNRGSRAVVSTDCGVLPRFEKMFICFDAQSRGFLQGCRPFIGLDGCFLKGPYGGHILSAVGRDGDDGIFPIAFVVVEVESKDSWGWFMTELEEVLGSLHRFTFISDRQKGLVEVFETKLHGIDHRFCVKHMYENFKKKHKGFKLRNEMWNAARSLTVAEFDQHMKIIKEVDNEAYEWLRKVSSCLWSRSKFDDNSKCDLVVNNLCETWNSNIVDAREKPIISMCEWIRGYLMHRFQQRREYIQKKSGLLCPDAQRKLDKRKEYVRHCDVNEAGQGRFEVFYKGKSEDVDLERRTCSCREWDVSGIPCHHAIPCIVHYRREPEEYVDMCFHRETFLRTYGVILCPMPFRNMMHEEGTAVILPPIKRTRPGRPKKARKKAPDEPTNSQRSLQRASRKKGHVRCTKCGELGHNARTCKATEARPPPTRKGKGGRPKLPRPDDALKMLEEVADINRRGGGVLGGSQQHVVNNVDRLSGVESIATSRGGGVLGHNQQQKVNKNRLSGVSSIDGKAGGVLMPSTQGSTSWHI